MNPVPSTPACAAEPDLFFDPALRDRARRICTGCPLLAACGSYARANPRLLDSDAVYAGRTGREWDPTRSAAYRPPALSRALSPPRRRQARPYSGQRRMRREGALPLETPLLHVREDRVYTLFAYLPNKAYVKVVDPAGKRRTRAKTHFRTLSGEPVK